MKRIVALLLALVLAASALTGCGTPHSKSLMTNITPGTIDDTRLSDISDSAVTDFAVRLFQASMQSEKNVLISPLSVLSALAMTANGADGQTRSQMESVLGMPIEGLNSWLYHYCDQLPENKAYTLNLANSIWVTEDERFTVNQDFLQLVADYYSADVYHAPFDDSTCREINAWVKDKTDGMIKQILNEIPSDAVLYLINALAFDAEWQNIYLESQIRDGIFTTEEQVVRTIEMMYAEEDRYLEDDHAIGFIKYYKDQQYAFAALLPEEGMTIAEYVATLDGEHLNTLLSHAQSVTVQTAIPKFESETDVEMSQILSEMGMPDAFDSTSADLSKLGRSQAGNLFINRVLHKAYISVEEKGTKAGAATVVEVTDECAMVVQDPKQVFLDRPFVYMLLDCQNNLPIFIGAMMDVNE